MSLLYLGASVQTDLLVPDRDFEAGRANFLYVAGTYGNVQKGLDLLIEAFARLPHLHLYIYCRVEYPEAIAALNVAIKAAHAGGYLGRDIKGSTRRFELSVRVGAGAYICGEETALLESLEGRLLLDATWTGNDVDGDLLKVTLVGEGGMTVTQPALVQGRGSR